MNKTIDYYQNNGNEFIDSTINLDMSSTYHLFEKHLPEKGTILDLGFGSGRDSLYFRKKYNVYSYDPTPLFVDNAKKMGLNNVYCKAAEQIDDVDFFDGIWACASLLHIEKENLLSVLNKCYISLKKDGIMYASFKYGDYIGEKNGRYFTYLTEKSFNEIIKKTNFQVIDIVITVDVREDREDEKWLNVILKKGNVKK